MAKQNYNRYNNFILDGQQTVVPYITLPTKSTDKYYGSATFGWLIMQGNPTYGGQEWNIPDGAILTIPFPLVASLQDYKNQLDNHFFYYGR